MLANNTAVLQAEQATSHRWSHEAGDQVRWAQSCTATAVRLFLSVAYLIGLLVDCLEALAGHTTPAQSATSAPFRDGHLSACDSGPLHTLGGASPTSSSHSCRCVAVSMPKSTRC